MSSRQLALRCLPGEGSARHIHAHLSLVINKEIINMPENVGIDTANGCMSAIHTRKYSLLPELHGENYEIFTFNNISLQEVFCSTLLETHIDIDYIHNK